MKLTFNRAKGGKAAMYGKKYREAVRMGAITYKEVARCRDKVKLGDTFSVIDVTQKKLDGNSNANRRVKKGNVIAKFRRLVKLDCGTSITYVQILQQQRNRWKFIE